MAKYPGKQTWEVRRAEGLKEYFPTNPKPVDPDEAYFKMWGEPWPGKKSTIPKEITREKQQIRIEFEQEREDVAKRMAENKRYLPRARALTRKEIVAMLQRYEADIFTIEELARIYEVSRTTVETVIREGFKDLRKLERQLESTEDCSNSGSLSVSG